MTARGEAAGHASTDAILSSHNQHAAPRDGRVQERDHDEGRKFECGGSAAAW